MKQRDPEYLKNLMVVYALMEGESRELGELHHAHRCDQACEAIYNILSPDTYCDVCDAHYTAEDPCPYH